MVPMTRQCAGTVAVAATGVAEVTTVFGTGSAEAGKDAVLQAAAGALARATLSPAAASRPLRSLNTSRELIPGCRPTTVPSSTPGDVSASAEVTLCPFSRTTALRAALLD